MSFQRAGKSHSATLNDAGGGNIPLGTLIKVIRACQHELEVSNEQDAAVRFEIFGDFLEEDVVKQGKPFAFVSRMIGL